MSLRQVFLINVPYQAGTTRAFVQPLGLFYLSSVLKKKGYTVEIFDFDCRLYDEQIFLGEIKKNQPLLVGLSVSSAAFGTTCNWVKRWKKESWFPPIILGGHHPTGAPFSSLIDSGADSVFRGEAEEGLPKLLAFLSNQEYPKTGQIPGLFLNGDPENTPCPVQLIADLDSLAYPSQEFTEYKSHYLGYLRKPPLIPILGSRGCPHRCRFCYNSNPERRQSYRERKIESVLAEIQEIRDKLDAEKEFFFLDDCFSVNRSRSLLLAQKLGKMNINWQCQCRIEDMDYTLIQEYVGNGCKGIYFGIETISDNAASQNKKSKDRERIYHVLNACRNAGIKTRGNFMLGFPEETFRDMRETSKFAAKLPLDHIEYAYVTPYPGSRIHKELVRQGKKINWQSFNPSKPTLLSPYLTENMLQESYYYAKALWVKTKQLKGQIIDENLIEEVKQIKEWLGSTDSWMTPEKFESLHEQIAEGALKISQFGRYA